MKSKIDIIKKYYPFYEGRLVKVDYASLDKFWGSDFKPNK